MDKQDFSVEILAIHWSCQVFLMSKGCRLTFTMCSPPLGIALTAVKDPVQPQVWAKETVNLDVIIREFLSKQAGFHLTFTFMLLK